MKKSILFVMMVCLGCACWIKPVQAQVRYAEEDENIVVVSNIEEFYEALSLQIREHKDIVSYDTYQGKLGTDFQKIFDEYYFSHNVENLPDSGSYLGRYIKDGEMWFRYGDFTGNHNLRIEVSIDYKYDKQELDEYFEHMKELAAQLKGESDFESVKAVHDYLIKNYDYDEQHQNYLDYEGYLGGTMVCQGYCMAAFLLLSEMDIPVRIVVGASEDYEADSDHAWNVVKVDGQWYNMDVTWDDKGGKTPPDYTFFLKSDSDFYKHTREGWYDYDKEMAIVSYPMPNHTGVEILIFVMVAAVIVMVFVHKRLEKREENEEII